MKRDIFSELMEGLESLADERQGKVTLRTHKVQLPKLLPITAEEVVAIRQQLNLSRSVFAMYLRTNTRTLENWEQGRATPNAQAATLIRLVERFPQTIDHLAALTCLPGSNKIVIPQSPPRYPQPATMSPGDSTGGPLPVEQ